MSFFIPIDNTVVCGQMVRKKKETDVNRPYNQDQVLTDINRMSENIHIFIGQKSLKDWKECVVQEDPSVDFSSQKHINLLFQKILTENNPKLEPEKQQQYVLFLSRFFSQSLFNYEPLYLCECGFHTTQSKLNIKIALHEEALYMQTSFAVPVLIPQNESGLLSNRAYEKLSNTSKQDDFRSKATYKIGVAQASESNCLKIEMSLLESKLTCRKEYEGKFNPQVTENNKLLYFIRLLLDKIRSFPNLIKYIFKKNNTKEQGLKKQTEEGMDIYSSNIHQKEEKVKLDTLYFDPILNKVAKNLEDFTKIRDSETIKSDNSDPLPLKEEAVVIVPTLRQTNDINNEEQYLNGKETDIHSSDTRPTEKKVKLDTLSSTKMAEKLTIASKSSINSAHTITGSKKQLNKSPLRPTFFKKEREKAIFNSESIPILGKGRS